MAVTADQVQALYIAYFNRPADYLGLSYQMAQADQFGLQYVANQFSKSPEYTTTFAGKGTAEIINTIYLNLFGRAAEPAGIKFWGDLLNSNTLTLGNIALSIYNGALNDDKIAVDNKLAAATAFYNSLDTSAEIVGYSGDAANQVLKNWLSSITTDSSLAAATTDAALLAVSTNATAAHDAVANVGQSFSLTSGVDPIGTFTGGAGADTFNAAPNATGQATLTALDSLDGGAGIDTINVIDTAAAGPTYVVSTVSTVKNIEIANITSVNNAVTADLSAWTGLTTANVVSAGGQTTKVAATASINATDTALAAGTVTATGGMNTTVTTSGGTHGGAINVTGATGNVVVVAGSVNTAGSNSGNAITITGGKTVTVTETASNSVLTGSTFTQGTVNVTGDATTTSVTVNEAATVASVTAVTAVTAVKEVFTATFVGAEAAGNTIIFDGVTYTVAGGGTASATATATAFVAAYNAAGGATWVAVDNGAGTVTFTKKTAVAVADTVNADFTGTGSHPTAAAPSVQGVTAVTGVTGVGGIAQGTVAIADKNAASATDANTITSVTLNGYGSASTVNSNALTTLSLSNSTNSVTVTDAGTTAKTDAGLSPCPA